MAGLYESRVAGVVRAENIERARKFYTEVLGLQGKEATGPTSEGVFLAGEGTAIMIYERPGMPAPQNTTLSFAVSAERFDEVAGELRAKGVTFEDYDVSEIGLKTVEGVAEIDGAKVAWFKDTEDNIIALVTM